MENTVFMNRYAYAALAITILSYIAFYSQALAGAAIVAPLVFLLKVAFLVLAFRSTVKMNIYGKILTWLLVALTIPTLFVALIVIASPFISFT